MEPDFGLGAGHAPPQGAGPGPRPPPGPGLRIAEWAGLLAVAWGLASGPWWLIPAGVVSIVGSYAVYRRRHGRVTGGGSDPGICDSDGGSD